MPSTFYFEIDFKLPKFDFRDATDLLVDCSYHIETEIKRRLRDGKDVYGRFMKALSPKTIADKRREGFSSDAKTPLIRTGTMLNAIRFKPIRKNVFEISIAPEGKPRRDFVALVHQFYGANPKAGVIRRFFGLTRKDEEWIYKRLLRWIDDRIKKVRVERKVIR